MKIGLDFDNVIVDIGKDYKSLTNETPAVSDGVIDLLQLNKVEIIITKRASLIPVIDWLSENVSEWNGELQSSMPWGDSKGLCCLHRDVDVFVDDGEHHVKDIEEQGIKAFLFNKEIDECPKKLLANEGYLKGGE